MHESIIEPTFSVNISTYYYNSTHVEHQISARERRMTTMMCLICATTLFSNVPIIVTKIVDSESEFKSVKAVLQFFYWSQFSVDFLVYAASNKQYREAYLLFIKNVPCRCCCCCCCRCSAPAPAPAIVAQQQQQNAILPVAMDLKLGASGRRTRTRRAGGTGPRGGAEQRGLL